MVGLVIDPEFDKNCPNGVLDHAYRMRLREQLSHPSTSGLEVQVIGGHHTMLAKKAMLKQQSWKNHEPIQSMSMHVYLNLPKPFAKYIGDEHNKQHQVQLQTTLVMRLRMVRAAWVKEKSKMDLGEHEKKSYNYISKYLDTRHIAGGVHPWPSSKNSAWRKEIYAEAWTTKKGGNISGNISNLITAAQRSDVAWNALMNLIAEIDK